jgi:ketosteroid isomerase-like protein
MSQENVEVVKRAISAVNERDIDRYLACCTEDVQLVTPVAEVGGACDGPEGTRRFFTDIADATPNFKIVIERLEPVGPDRILGFMRVTGTGRASGIPIENATGNVYVLRERRPREAMRRTIERAAVCDSPDPQRRVLSVADAGVVVDSPLADDDPTEWTHAKHYREAATMLTRLGSGRCLVCGDALACDGPRQRRRYCAVHEPQASIRERADREAILALLNSVADALRID